ncbi:hypothetical protein MUK42_10358 [Musa troglodytarum]|uniref:Uncharacterized protein n=1 Tax=Musa troglodytarum TaxID=320322 RepID=A0A9E7GB94_9LILI|nr:hypothetical protein MUK42_10358 [Musa troglodytarum]
MDVSTVSILRSTNFFCRFSPFRPKSASSAPSTKHSSRKGTVSSIIFLKTPSCRGSSNARSSGGRVLQVSARFRGPSRRRNTLREKLLPSTVEQVRRVPQTLDPVLDLELSEDFSGELEDLRTNADRRNEIVEAVGFGSGDSSEKKSVLWDKLESWVDQYKADSEFWGVGTGPIFMIYQDSDRKVVRVLVNEDEIIKRNQIREATDVNAKIFRAKLIANMIEGGEYALPRNSSVVKVVVEGKKLSFVDGIHSISLRARPFLKMFPRMGFILFCSCCVLWAIAKLFVQNDKVELSRQEAKMLRRKIKLRMEREKMEKGTVKVLDDAHEFPVSSRPQLDINELTKSIVQAKASTDKSFITDSSSHLNVTTQSFDDKVREIREMARKVREQERQDSSDNETSKKTETDPISWAKNKESTVDKNNTILETEATGDKSDFDITSLSNSLTHQEEDMEFHVDGENKEIFGKSTTEHFNKTPCQELLNSLQDNGNNMDIEGHHEKEVTRSSSGAHSTGVDAETVMNYDSISRGDILRNGGNLGNNDLHSSIVEERITGSSSSDVSGRSTFRVKPIIITSVDEAREYLAQRHGMLSDTIQSGQEVQVTEQSAGINAWSHYNDDKTMESINPRNIEDMSVAETSDKLQDKTFSRELYGDEFASASLLKRPSSDDFSITKSYVDDAVDNKLTVDMQNSKMQEEKNLDVLSDSHGQIFVSQNSVNGTSDLSDSDTSTKLSSNEVLLEVVNKIDLQTDSCAPIMKNLSEKREDAHDRRDECTSNTSVNKVELETNLTSSSDGVKSLIVDPLKDDVLSQSQEADILKDDNKLCEELQELQGKTDSWNVSKRKNNYVNAGSDETAENTMVGTSKMDHDNDTLSDFDTSLQSMTEEQDSLDIRSNVSGELEMSKSNANVFDGATKKHNENSLLGSPTNSQCDSGEVGHLINRKQLNAEKNWVKENFQEFDPLITKIAVGFKENYMAAKEKIQQQPSLSPDISELRFMEGDDELEWMNDERLQKIVFQVRENELTGKDPFYLINADDKLAFFEGLEKKAEKINGNLLRLHEWVHSRIENLDYGADGIGLNDPLEKIIPSWKGPPIDKDPEFLKHQKPMFSEEVKENNLQETDELPNSKGVSPYSSVNGIRKMSLDASSAKPKTLIESSDGTSRVGKKKGTEQWQHTKKWSQGFLEVYNAEEDPEIKSIMREMGKDLDRWITEKETKDVADLMTKIPKRKQRYIEKKLEKLKREVQMFGTPAVASKYKEYTDEKEEDYLWWLDLPFVLCIELYTIEEGTPKVGFYSLEMAADLELDPKQYHVIAFEDPGDSKNFCYILQSHMDMLGSGKAFVVARPPKDAFREAKANGFYVTVIRKGLVKLNVDQTLEEVEEEITEIGSKMYHDKIMRERSFDVNTIMKGVIAADKSTNRRSRQKLTKPTKPAKS